MQEKVKKFVSDHPAVTLGGILACVGVAGFCFGKLSGDRYPYGSGYEPNMSEERLDLVKDVVEKLADKK